jgi:Asp-tRNA(Asn)/Glu-tRNA(Gln) amidotransferase A subunit family amidase
MGLFARRIADIAILRSVLSGVEPAPPIRDIRGARIGVCRTMNWTQAQPESVHALESGARSLAAAGAKVNEVEMPAVFADINQSFNVISGVEALRALALEARDHFSTLNYWIKNSLTTANRVDQTQFDKAHLHVVQCQRAMAEVFKGCDAIITPSTSGEAIADIDSVSNSVFNRIWTLLHVPCVTIPAFEGPTACRSNYKWLAPSAVTVSEQRPDALTSLRLTPSLLQHVQIGPLSGHVRLVS